MTVSPRARRRRGWLRGAAVSVVSGLTLAASVAVAQPTPEVEPNDSVATANPIVIPGIPTGFRSGVIGVPGDVDFYSAAVRAGDFLFVFANGDPEQDGVVTDLVVSLLAPDGVTVLLTANSPPTGDSGIFPFESFNFTVQTTGTHFIRVAHTGSGTGTYTLRVLILKEPAVVTGAGPGGGPHVRSFEGADGVGRLSFYAYDPAFPGGAHVASCDLNGDGFPDIVAGAGPGGGPRVRSFNGVTGDQLPGLKGSFFAYNPGFAGGVFVACADVNGDGVPDIITGAGPGGGPHVKVFDGVTLALLQSFYAYDPGFLGGVAVAAGDVTGVGRAAIVTGAGPGGGPHVKVFDGVTLALLQSFYAYDPGFPGGVAVAAGDVTGVGRAAIVTGAGPGGGPHVKVFDGVTLALLQSFYAYDPGFLGGVAVAAGDVTGAGRAAIVTGAGPGGGPHLRVFDGVTLAEIWGGFSYLPAFTGGVFPAAP